MTLLYPLRFRPVLRPYLWGGRRLETALGKSLPPGGVWAESWEVVDRGADQSVVEFGPLAGATLHELVAQRGGELLGRHDPQPRFPLLLKFLDAAETLSVQVHPDDAAAARLATHDWGKTEAWVVLEAPPGSLIYAGLKPGVDRRSFAAALADQRCPDCLHSFAATAGDCIFLPAGSIHALGAGVLAAEIQQSSDATFRLFDWNRVGPDHKPRPLHVEQALAAIDFRLGPLRPVRPRPAARPEVQGLVECDKFCLDRWEIDSPAAIGGDGRFHVLAVVTGAVLVGNDPADRPLPRGGTALLPAATGPVRLVPAERTVLLDAYLP